MTRHPSFLTTRRGFAKGLAGSALSALALSYLPSASAQVACTLPPSDGARFTPDTGLAVRLRKQVDQLDFVELTKLKSAYAAMKLLSASDPADPRGYDQQANIHCIYCGGSLEIHKSFFFFPWHRAYLYFHERILGKLIGDPTFTLPYWSWETAGHQQLPSAYFDPTLTLNPLYNPKRAVNNTSTIPPSVIRLAAPPLPGTIEEQLRIGSAGGFLGQANNAGQLEGSPHGTIHTWISSGDPAVGREDMGRVRTAARDPVFFAHHGNIDRLWTEWIAIPGHQNHADPAWLDKRWTFWDENRRLVSISVRDVLDHENSLRYRYATALRANVVPAAPRNPGPVLTVPLHTGPVNLGPAPFTATVPISLDQRGTLLASRPEVGRSILLEVGGVDVPPTATALVRVFLNKPDANTATPVTDPAFIDSLSVPAVAADAADVHVHQKHGMLLDVTDKLQLALLNVLASNVSITLVPVGPNSQPPPGPILSFESITLRAIEN